MPRRRVGVVKLVRWRWITRPMLARAARRCHGPPVTTPAPLVPPETGRMATPLPVATRAGRGEAGALPDLPADLGDRALQRPLGGAVRPAEMPRDLVREGRAGSG